jgi:hypothetical protein
MADIFLQNRIRTMKSEGKTNTEILEDIASYQFFDYHRFEKNGDLTVRFSATKRVLVITAKTLALKQV